jgi:hypothetical protein
MSPEQPRLEPWDESLAHDHTPAPVSLAQDVAAMLAADLE